MIVTGDVTQIDLPEPAESGLIDAARRLRRIRGIGFVTLDKQDIVRHRLVQRIVEAYGDTPFRPSPSLDAGDPNDPTAVVSGRNGVPFPPHVEGESHP
jgi:phosphate starvation-inducible PhoH-like protein